MFRGRFEHSIDGKGRLSVPARFREALAQRFDGDMNLVVVPNERCLEVHPLSQWEAIEARAHESSLFDERTRDFGRLYVSRARDVEIDTRRPDPAPARLAQAGGARQGRHAGRRGLGRFFEVWDRRRFEEYERTHRHTLPTCSSAWRPRSLAVHVPVLVDEVAFLLRPRREGWVIDGTVGMGGHAAGAAGAKRAPSVRLLGLDADPEALRGRGARLAPLRRPRPAGARQLPRPRCRGRARTASSRPRAVLLDLGMSSYAARGVGARVLLPGRRAARHAARSRARRAPPPTLLNRLPEAELARLLHEYGEERTRGASRAPSCAAGRSPPPATSSPPCARRCPAQPGRAGCTWPRGRSRPCAWPSTTSRAPSAQALPARPRCSALGGRLGVISFHSGEDRIVKQTFRALEAAGFAELEPSPLPPGDDEVRANPRARSAKLRVLERLP